MRNAIFILAVLISSFVIVISSCHDSSPTTTVCAPKMDSAAMVQRGKYLVSAIGCDDCHSPKRMGANGPEIIPELRFSGFPHNGKLPPIDTAAVNKGWALFA